MKRYKMKVVVIQGPNLNMLGVREQHVYGPMKLEEIHAQMKEFGTQNSVEVNVTQKVMVCFSQHDLSGQNSEASVITQRGETIINHMYNDRKIPNTQ